MGNFSEPSLVKILHMVFRNPPSKLDSQTMADLVGKPYATLMSELSCQPGHKLGADLILPLCRVTESSEPIKFLARQMGGVLFKDIKPSSALDPAKVAEGLVKTLAESIKEFSEFCTDTATSIADGKIEQDELNRITKEGQEAVESILSMINLAKATHQAQEKSA